MTAAIYSKIERFHLPSHFDRQALADEIVNATLGVFADSDGYGLRTPVDDWVFNKDIELYTIRCTILKVKYPVSDRAYPFVG